MVIVYLSLKDLQYPEQPPPSLWPVDLLVETWAGREKCRCENLFDLGGDFWVDLGGDGHSELIPMIPRPTSDVVRLAPPSFAGAAAGAAAAARVAGLWHGRMTHLTPRN